MELRQLRYFVGVATEGNISRAAQKLFLTQPALSRQIKALEEEVGAPLLERQAHSIRLTRAGEALLPEARALLAQAEGMFERVKAAGRGVRLRVGYAPSLAAGMLSAAVLQFTQRHPAARVELADLSTAEMLAGLEKETLDVAITTREGGHSKSLHWTPLVQTPWRLVVGRCHPLASKTSVRPAEVAKQRLLIFSKRDYPEYWEGVSRWFKSIKASPVVAGEHDGVESLVAAVASGLGVALLAPRAGHFLQERAKLLPIVPEPPQLCVAAGRLASRVEEKPLAEFVEELLAAARLEG